MLSQITGFLLRTSPSSLMDSLVIISGMTLSPRIKLKKSIQYSHYRDNFMQSNLQKPNDNQIHYTDISNRKQSRSIKLSYSFPSKCSMLNRKKYTEKKVTHSTILKQTRHEKEFGQYLSTLHQYQYEEVCQVCSSIQISSQWAMLLFYSILHKRRKLKNHYKLKLGKIETMPHFLNSVKVE